jgi:hypothetical protein
VRNTENFSEDNKESLLSDACELGFQHLRHRHHNSCHEEGEENESEEERESSEGISHSMTLRFADTTRLHGSKRVRTQ